jgi:hypothetical protein
VAPLKTHSDEPNQIRFDPAAPLIKKLAANATRQSALRHEAR